MSYCRFSTNNFESDVYVYSHILGGITIHVAANRITTKAPEGGLLSDHWKEWIENAERKNIGGEHDGACYSCGSIEEAIEKLYELRSKGYRVPTVAFERLLADMEPSEP